jgi:probable HAF family extracellular repeat protein
MRIYSKDKFFAARKAVAWTLITLLAACGDGRDNPLSAINTPGSGANLAATTTAVAVVTPASYTVANIGAGFEIEVEDHRVLNDRGQVAGSIANGDWTMARAYRYEGGTLTDLGTLGNTNNSSRGWAINASGLVAGDLRIGNIFDGVTHAFRSDGTTMTDLGALGNPNNNSYTTAINDSGLVIGDSRYGNGYTVHAFRSDGTTMTDLGALGNPNNQSGAVAINAGGLVAGISYNGTAYHAFRSDGTTMTDLGALGNPNNPSSASAINAGGLVAGSSYNGTAYHAFRSDGTTMTDLGALGNPNNQSFAVSINASGQVVGRSQTAPNSQTFPNVDHAFIKSPGDSQMIDLNSRLINAPGVELFRAVAISDSGYILAEANTGWVLLKPSAPIPAPAAATLGAITANDPVAVGMPVNISVQFSDIDTTDTHTAVWIWEGNGNSAGTVTEPNGTVSGTVTGSTIYAAAGVYNVTVSVTDSGGLSSSVSRQVVVYDPSAGFVTGGGWIMSPAGAYKADERLSGRATFGFVSKYLKGANKPSGETEFRFQAAGLNFYSNNYDWLVVGGARAQYKGTGTINGRGSYQFLLTAVDGDLIAKGTADRFRIKIWHRDDSANADVTDYDNQLDSTVAGSNQEGTILGGGSISVRIR